MVRKVLLALGLILLAMMVVTAVLESAPKVQQLKGPRFTVNNQTPLEQWNNGFYTGKQYGEWNNVYTEI